MSDSLSQRHLAGTFATCGAAVLGVLAWPMLRGAVWLNDDLGAFYLIARAFHVEWLAQGETPLWWPQLDAGLFLHGAGQLGLFHPLRHALYALLPLPWSFNVDLLTPYVLLGLGAAWTARRLGAAPSAAVLGGVLAATAGFPLLRFVHPNVVAVAAHVPWLVGALHVLLASESPRARAAAVLAIALLTGSQLLVHFPQLVVMSLQVEAVAAVALAWPQPGRGARVLALRWLPAKLLGIGMGTVQLWPSWEYAAQTVRAAADVGFRSTYSLPPSNLLAVFSPWLFSEGAYLPPGEPGNPHELGSYAGLVGWVLAGWCALRWRALDAGRRRALVALAFLLVLSLDLALGRHGLLHRLWLELPIVGLFRAPARHLFVVHLALAGIATLGADDLLRRRADTAPLALRRAWPLFVPALLGLLAALIAASWQVGALAGPEGAGAQLSSPVGWLVAPLVAAVLAGAALRAARGRPIAVLVLGVVGIVDAAAPGLASVLRQDPVAWQRFRTPPEGWQPPDRLHRLHGGITDLNANTPNRYALWGAHLVNGYAGATPRSHLDYRRTGPLRVAGVVRARVSASDGDDQWLELPGALPRVRLVSRVLVTERPAAALRSIDPARVALVDRPLELDGGVPGDARLERDVPGHVRIATRAPARRLLVFAEKAHPGWRARVDGREAPILRAYGDFLGVAVPAGESRVELDFAPRSVRAGALVSLASLWAALGLGGWLAWCHGPRDTGRAASGREEQR